jgi:hypothetical protein
VRVEILLRAKLVSEMEQVLGWIPYMMQKHPFALRVEILMTRLVMRKPVERCHAPVDRRIINLPSDINLSFKQPMIQFIYI